MLSAFVLALTLSGVVHDPLGAVVPGASVVARPSGGAEQRAVTGPEGTFTLTVPAGDLVLIVRAGGFAEQVERLSLDADRRDLVVVLSPATVLEDVTVTATRGEQRLGRRAGQRQRPRRRARFASRRPSSPTTCCGRSRPSACSGGRAACRRIRRRRACRCAASGRAASAARSCCSTASRSTIRSADGCTGRACRSKAPIASRSSTARAPACTATTRWAA